jgi:4-hydroxythreonine-4-phosphate dehydrogenase
VTQDLPHIVLTPGEPAGIGPDLAVLLAQRELSCRLVVIADPTLLQTRAALLNRSLELIEWHNQPHRAGTLALLPQPLSVAAQPGAVDVANAGYVLASIDRAVDGCVAGHFDALVTGPVHKGVINDAGFLFSGHTEYLAQRTGAPCPVMLLTTGVLRVALVTTHLPLAEVSDRLTSQRLEQVVTVLAGELESKLGVPQPRIAVCGLNPHAGEGGYLGREEIEVIEPVVARLKQSGLRLTGPLPADTVFTPGQLENFDVVLTMYHDQGLPVLKYAGFGEAVNITLGLPIIRTSVDHGTALNLAGTGKVDIRSLEAAVDRAIEIARRRTAEHTPRKQMHMPT